MWIFLLLVIIAAALYLWFTRTPKGREELNQMQQKGRDAFSQIEQDAQNAFQRATGLAHVSAPTPTPVSPAAVDPDPLGAGFDSRDAFLAWVHDNGQRTLLDGQEVRGGNGPALSFRTTAGGRIVRD